MYPQQYHPTLRSQLWTRPDRSIRQQRNHGPTGRPSRGPTPPPPPQKASASRRAGPPATPTLGCREDAHHRCRGARVTPRHATLNTHTHTHTCAPRRAAGGKSLHTQGGDPEPGGAAPGLTPNPRRRRSPPYPGNPRPAGRPAPLAWGGCRRLAGDLTMVMGLRGAVGLPHRGARRRAGQPAGRAALGGNSEVRRRAQRSALTHLSCAECPMYARRATLQLPV
eukprot:scaffold1344_cov388-Prasinococcus_capsulatus_cf.AAC.9